MTTPISRQPAAPQKTTAEIAVKVEGRELTEALATVREWRIEDDHLVRDFSFKGYRRAVGFANEVAAIADAQRHHPDVTFGWGKARVAVCTHDVGGFSQLDFALATAVDAAFAKVTRAGS